MESQVPAAELRERRFADVPFFLVMGGLSASFVTLIVLLIAADLMFTSLKDFRDALMKPEIQAAFRLTMLSCTAAAILSLWVATPLGYLLSRFRFPGRWIVDTLVDIPIVLPPLGARSEFADSVSFEVRRMGFRKLDARYARNSSDVSVASSGARAVHCRVRFRNSNNACHIRSNRSALRRCRANTRLLKSPSVPSNRFAASLARNVDCYNARLGKIIR